MLCNITLQETWDSEVKSFMLPKFVRNFKVDLAFVNIMNKRNSTSEFSFLPKYQVTFFFPFSILTLAL